uniref:Pollen preferential protein n=1 Tax=Kalanchoe fedtschenkoi TaxID=63787 RepID=A0A7N0UUH6_KALFE
MSGGQVVVRRHPLLSKQSSSCSGSARFAEVAGGTAAECAVLCCCCPCAILNLAFMALYTLPAGICRRMLRNMRGRKQRLLKKKGLVPRRRCTCGCEGTQADRLVYPVGTAATFDEVEKLKEEKEVMNLEKEMWDTFYSTGFWRSPSQREKC